MRAAQLTDIELAARLAEGAGQLLLGVRHGGLLQGRELGAAGDGLAQAWIDAALRANRPRDAILSEEADDSRTRLDEDRLWIIDPLDGTSGFRRGHDDWAVHVALTVGGAPTLGAVAIPTTGELFRSDAVSLPPRPSGRIVSSAYVSYETAAVARDLGLQVRTMGSAGVKAMSVVRGDTDAYLVTNGQHEWDSCAPVAVALAAGLHCSRIDGSPIVYNTVSTYQSDYLICRPELATPILTILRELF